MSTARHDSAVSPATNAARPEVVVIGGGLAGLAAAHRLVNAAPELRVTVLEASAHFGGKIQTEREGPYQFELGPDSFLAAKPRGVGLVTELGLGDALIAPLPQPHRAFVRSHGRLQELPEGLSGLVPTRLGPVFRSRLLSIHGKARFAGDFVVPARPDDADESLAAFVTRRLGREAYARLVEPLMAGIYAGDGERLSLLATFPQLRQAELTHGSLIRGVLAGRAAPAGPPRPAFLTPAAGLATVVAALTARLAAGGTTLRRRAAVSSVTADPAMSGPTTYRVSLADGESVMADGVIFAAPAFVGGRVLTTLDAGLAGELAAIPHGSTAIVFMAWPRSDIEHPLASHGYVIPRIEGSPALAATFVSEKWAGRAPAGDVLIRVFLGRFGQDEMTSRDDADLIRLARHEVTATLGITAAPRVTRVHRWPWGMPQYVLGHPARLARIDALVAAHPGFALAGNAYRGVGLPDVIASGERAAEAIMAELAESAARAARTRSA